MNSGAAPWIYWEENHSFKHIYRECMCTSICASRNNLSGPQSTFHEQPNAMARCQSWVVCPILPTFYPFYAHGHSGLSAHPAPLPRCLSSTTMKRATLSPRKKNSLGIKKYGIITPLSKLMDLRARAFFLTLPMFKQTWNSAMRTSKGKTKSMHVSRSRK